MRRITPQFPRDLQGQPGTFDVAKSDPVTVPTFRSLMEHVARLSYLNKDHLLFFRGQPSDYKNRAGASSFYPSIYRGERVTRAELETRFEVLQSAGARLTEAFHREKIDGAADVRRRRIIQWSILQHYEVCPTPLLDFTQSLRVACSFALSPAATEPHFYVFGLPYLTNRISVNSEQDVINVRLLSICPPDALRPYFQEGYLAGTDEVTTEYISKDELDFNARLIAKFKPEAPGTFWGNGFDPIPMNSLYPEGDRILELCAGIRSEIADSVRPADLGRFLQAWSKLESKLLSLARARKDRVFSVVEALRVLRLSETIPGDLLERIDALRTMRNRAVHQPEKTRPGELAAAAAEIEHALEALQPSITHTAV